MPKVVEGNEYVIVKEVAQLLRKSTTWVYRAGDPDSRDPLPGIRIKRTLLYEVEDLRDWISRHKVESGDKLPGGDGNARDWRIRMSRKRYQAGFVRKRGKNVQTQYWEGNWREYVRGEASPKDGARSSVWPGKCRRGTRSTSSRNCCMRSTLPITNRSPRSAWTNSGEGSRSWYFPTRSTRPKRTCPTPTDLYFKPDLGPPH